MAEDPSNCILNEERFVHIFCDTLGKGYCEQAKEHAEKARHGDIPSAVLNSLMHLAQYERAYTSLYFLEQKWFSRRDPLKNAFLNLQNELNTAADHWRKTSNTTAKQKARAKLFVNVCRDLSNYCSLRSDCIDLYEQMLKFPVSWNLNDVEKMVKEILEKYEDEIKTNCVSSLRSTFENELNILQTLLRTSCEISEWSFFPSLMNLYQVCQKLEENVHLLKKETVKSGFFSFRDKPTTPTSAVHQWLHRFHQTLMSKFTLYFYKALSEQTESTEEMRGLCTRNNIDYALRCNSLCKKNDHTYVVFVLDCHQLSEMPRHGYTLPMTKPTQRNENYMKIVEFPNKVQQTHYDFLDINFQETKSSDKITNCYDKQTASNYYIVCIEPRIYMAVITEGKKPEKDSNIVAFVNEILSALKPKKIFSALRPGSNK